MSNKKTKKPTVKKVTPKKTFWVYENNAGVEFISEVYCVHTRKVEATSISTALKLINK